MANTRSATLSLRETRDQETAGKAGEGLGAQFELSDCGRCGGLRLRSGKNASRGSSGGPGRIWTLHQERGHEGVAVVVGN